MGAMLSDSLWKQILDKQIRNLNSIQEISNIDHGYENKPSPIPLGYGRTWKHIGFERIVMDLNCCAVMDCNPRKKQDKYIINPSEERNIKVSKKHKLEIMFPRGYPHDEVFWGVFFHGEVPMYPNIAKLDGNGLTAFSKDTPLGGPHVGTLCMGIDEASNDISAIVKSLISYLKFQDKDQHTPISAGGRNDKGFDHPLADHMLMNFEVLKKAVEKCSQTNPKAIDFGSKKLDPIIF